MRQIEALLDEFYTQDEAQLWLSLPHPQLEGRVPNDVIADGRADEVLAILRRLNDGAYL